MRRLIPPTSTPSCKMRTKRRVLSPRWAWIPTKNLALALTATTSTTCALPNRRRDRNDVAGGESDVAATEFKSRTMFQNRETILQSGPWCSSTMSAKCQREPVQTDTITKVDDREGNDWTVLGTGTVPPRIRASLTSCSLRTKATTGTNRRKKEWRRTEAMLYCYKHKQSENLGGTVLSHPQVNVTMASTWSIGNAVFHLVAIFGRWQGISAASYLPHGAHHPGKRIGR